MGRELPGTTEPHFPHVKREWTIGNLAAVIASLLSVLTILGAWWLGISGLVDNANKVPGVVATQASIQREVDVLKSQRISDKDEVRQLQESINRLGKKIDHQNDLLLQLSQRGTRP